MDANNTTVALTDEQISKGARYLSDSSAELCNVDKDDNWKVYGQDFIDEFRAACLAASAVSVPSPVAPIPEGWALVPIEPTLEMKSRGLHVYPDMEYLNIAADVWLEMLAHTPAAPIASPSATVAVAQDVQGRDAMITNGIAILKMDYAAQAQCQASTESYVQAAVEQLVDAGWRAAPSLPAVAPQELSGWQLVPLAPTQAMIGAWQDAPSNVKDGMTDEQANTACATSAWRAMCSAAPRQAEVDIATPTVGSVDTPEFRQKLFQWAISGDWGAPVFKRLVSHLDARIEAARQDAAGALSIQFEKVLCAKLGRDWSPTGMSAMSLVEDLATRTPVQVVGGEDTARLDFIESHPEMRLSRHKKHWSIQGFTNYQYDVFKTLREAIDAALNKAGSSDE
jgi:hypothetical protein